MAREMTIKLTDRVAATLGCPAGKRTHNVPDKTGNGLMLSVSSTGRRFWKFRYDYCDRRNAVMTIGPFPLIGYEEAKVEAARLQRMVKVEKRDPRIGVYNPKTATTVSEAIDAWLLANPHRNTPTVKACQSASKRDPLSACNRDPLVRSRMAVTDAPIAGLGA